VRDDALGAYPKYAVRTAGPHSILADFAMARTVGHDCSSRGQASRRMIERRSRDAGASVVQPSS